MPFNLLVIHEIAYKASLVTSRRKLKEFERWITDVIKSYNDSAVETVARIHLFKLRDQYSF